MQRKRNEFNFSLVIILLLGLLIGNVFSSYVAAQTGSVYEDLEIFSDALSIVQNEYVEEVSTETLIYGALTGMLNGLDAHSQFMRPEVYKELKVETEGHFGGLGIVIQLDKNKMLTVVSPLEDTPAFRAGILSGDKIIKINGEPTHGLVLEEAVNRLRGPKGSDVTITILRIHEGEKKAPEEFDVTLTRDDIKIPSVKWKMLEEGIGYIRLVEFSERTGRDLQTKVNEMDEMGMRSLVLDLRNNPGGLLNVAAEVSDKFLDKGRLIVYTESRTAKENLRFKAKQDPIVDREIPVVILVNAGSASASEIVAGALSDWRRAVIMGQKTFGKGSVQSIIPLADGSALRLTTAKYLTPDGHSINGVGITPDIEVKMDMKKTFQILNAIEGAKNLEIPGEEDEEELVDVQLNRAIDLLKGYDILKSLDQNIEVAKRESDAAEEEVETAEEENETEASEDMPPQEDILIMPDNPEKEEILEEAPSGE